MGGGGGGQEERGEEDNIKMISRYTCEMLGG